MLLLQVMPIPAARHPTLLAAEIMESQYHLCWQNLLRASSPTILPALSSCSRNGSCTQGWAILVLQSSRLCHLKRNLELFPLNQLIRAQHCTAALGPPLGYSWHLKRKYVSSQRWRMGQPMVPAALSSCELCPSSIPLISEPPAVPHCSGLCLPWEGQSQCLEVTMTPVRRKWPFAGFFFG